MAQNFERLKNREDNSDFDDFLTKSIAATRSSFSKVVALSKNFSRTRPPKPEKRKFLKKKIGAEGPKKKFRGGREGMAEAGGVWGGFGPPAKLGGSGGALPPQQKTGGSGVQPPPAKFFEKFSKNFEN